MNCSEKAKHARTNDTNSQYQDFLNACQNVAQFRNKAACMVATCQTRNAGVAEPIRSQNNSSLFEMNGEALFPIPIA
jgi:hypothetical protein